VSFIIDPGCLHILRKLHNRKTYGAAHTPEERVKGWAFHGLSGNPDALRAFEKCYKELVRDEIIIRGLKNKDMHIWLNSKKSDEIKKIITQDVEGN